MKFNSCKNKIPNENPTLVFQHDVKRGKKYKAETDYVPHG